MTEAIGTAKIALTMDLTDLTASIARGKGQLTQFGTEAGQAFDASNSKVRAAASSFAKYIETLGKSNDEIRQMRALWAGVPTNVLDEMNAKLTLFRQNEAVTNANTQMLADSFSNMQVKARNAFKDLQNSAREEQMLRDANAARALAQATELAGIKAEHAAQGLAFLNQQADAARIHRMQQAVQVFGGSLEQLQAGEFGADNAAKKFTATIAAQEAGLRRAGNAAQSSGIQFNQYGLSAKQQVAALRQVPAQLTDIFVSLQGGQNPLTVLLQQGGQLKDVFGGIVPAARALGGALMNLINPWTLLAVAIGAVGYAYLQIEGRDNEFNKALIMTGQSSTTTATQLRAMAGEMDNIAGVTSRQAAAALTAVVASGKIAADQYVLVAKAAVEMQNATGKAMADTIAEYAQLARDPTSAVLQLNEAENFLTASIFDRIAALQDAGRIEEAAALATETRANAQIQRSGEVRESMGLVTGAWYDIKRGTAEAFDEAVNYFDRLDHDAKDAAKTLGGLWNAWRTGGVAGAFMMNAAINPPSTGAAAPSAADAAAQERVTSQALQQLKALRDGNKTREERQAQEEKQIINLNKQLGYEEKSVKVQRELAASRKAYQASLPKGKDGSGAARSLANAEASAQLQAIKDTASQEQNVIQNSTKLLAAQYSARLVDARDYYAQQRALMEQGTKVEENSLLAQIAVLKNRTVAGKDSVNVLKQIGQLEAQLAKVRADGATSLTILGIQEEDVAKKRKLAIDGYKDALDASLDASKRSADAALLRIIMGEQEAAQEEKVAAVLQRGADERKRLAREFAETNDVDAYNEKLALLESFIDDEVATVQDGYDRMLEAQGNWLNGVSSGVADWMAKTSDVAGQVNAITVRSFDTIADAMSDAALTGKLAWKDMLISILTDIEKFMMKQAVLGFLKAFIGAIGNQYGFQGGTENSFFANGGAMDGSRGLSAYSGQVVSKPTMFAFAHGTGVMGEAGPEGIFPLQRGADGKLGVKALGGGGGDVYVTVQTNITATGRSSESRTAGDDTKAMKGFADDMRTIAEQAVDRAMKPGGRLWKAGVTVR